VYTNIYRQRVTVTGSVIVIGWVGGWSTLNLIVRQWYWTTHGVTEWYIEIHQTTTTLQMLTLTQYGHRQNVACTIEKKSKTRKI